MESRSHDERQEHCGAYLCGRGKQRIRRPHRRTERHGQRERPPPCLFASQGEREQRRQEIERRVVEYHHFDIHAHERSLIPGARKIFPPAARKAPEGQKKTDAVCVRFSVFNFSGISCVRALCGSGTWGRAFPRRSLLRADRRERRVPRGRRARRERSPRARSLRAVRSSFPRTRRA